MYIHILSPNIEEDNVKRLTLQSQNCTGTSRDGGQLASGLGLLGEEVGGWSREARQTPTRGRVSGVLGAACLRQLHPQTQDRPSHALWLLNALAFQRLQINLLQGGWCNPTVWVRWFPNKSRKCFSWSVTWQFSLRSTLASSSVYKRFRLGFLQKIVLK